MNKTQENQRFSVPRKFPKFSRKAQGLSINVIIIVAIALIVLVVLIAVFTGQMGIWVTSLKGSKLCSDQCTAVNMVMIRQTERICQNLIETDGYKQYPGTADDYGDVIAGYVCCCKPK